jgi:hypothetical protein
MFFLSTQVGPGESSDEQEVLFRFRSVRKMSALCFGVLGVGRRTPPSTDPPDNGKGRKRVRVLDSNGRIVQSGVQIQDLFLHAAGCGTAAL